MLGCCFYTVDALRTGSWVPFTKHDSFMHPLDHIRMELEQDVQAEQAQAEYFIDLDLDQDKHGYINECSLSFILNLCFMFHYECAFKFIGL
jgi:hypothetical protein